METNQCPMTEQERATYTKFIEWLKQSRYGVPDSDIVLPYVAERYTPEEARLLSRSLPKINIASPLKKMLNSK